MALNQFTKKKDKVAICGAAPASRDNAPFDDPEYEIWSFADWICAPWLKRVDAIFEVHSAVNYMQHPRTPDYWEVLQTIEFPVFMYPIADPRVPGSIEYPLDEILEMVGSVKQKGTPVKPLNCSTAYASALAIYLGYDVIDVYGVELATVSPYMKQKAVFTFWAGVAAGRKQTLNINCSDGLLVQPLYGFEDEMPTSIIAKSIQKLNGQIQEAERVKLRAMGANQLAETLLNYRGLYKQKGQ